MIIGIGIDAVKINRMRLSCIRRGERLLKKVFTPNEIGFCFSKKDPYSHLSARFAAKEAFLKAIGIGIGRGVNFKDIEILTDASGAPKLNFHGSSRERIEMLGVKDAFVSLTHTGDYAVAIVVLSD